MKFVYMVCLVWHTRLYLMVCGARCTVKPYSDKLGADCGTTFCIRDYFLYMVSRFIPLYRVIKAVLLYFSAPYRAGNNERTHQARLVLLIPRALKFQKLNSVIYAAASPICTHRAADPTVRSSSSASMVTLQSLSKCIGFAPRRPTLRAGQNEAAERIRQ